MHEQGPLYAIYSLMRHPGCLDQDNEMRRKHLGY